MSQSRISKKLTRLQKFSLYFFDNPKISIGLWIVVLFLGILSYNVFLRREGFPSVDVPISVVNASYFVDDESKVDSELAKPASQVIKSLEEVKDVRVQSTKNFAIFSIQFKNGISSDNGSKKVSEKLAQSDLPQSAEFKAIAIEAAKFNGEYDLVVGGFGANISNPEQLQKSAEQVAEKLKNVENVTNVTVVPLIQTGLNPFTGQESTEQVSFDRIGVVDDELSFFPSVSIGLKAKDGVDTLKLYDAVSKKISEIQGDPLELVVTATFAETIRDQISSLQRSLVEGLIVVVIVSLILISWRTGLATALSMITVLGLTVTALWAIGYSLNTITLFGLILCLGLIVDDVTIVAEAIDAGKRSGKDKREIVATAIRKVARASLSGTLTTMLAFAPMIFIGGILGGFIRALPITIIISLAFSLLVSLSLIPFLTKNLILSDRHMKSENKLERTVASVETFIVSRLSNVLMWAKRTTKRKFMIGLLALSISFISLVGAGYYFTKIKFDIFPNVKDSNGLLISVKFAPDTEIKTAQQYSDRINNRIKETIGNFVLKASFDSTGTKNGAEIRVDLIDFEERDETAPQIAEKLQTELSKLGVAEIKVSQQGVGPPKDDYPFSVQITSEDPEKASLLGNDIKSFLSSSVLTRNDGSVSKIVRTQYSPNGTITRINGSRVATVRAGFDADDTSTLVLLAENLVKNEFDQQRLDQYGVKSEDVKFDFGFEEENQDSFKAMIKVFPVLLVMMYILLIVQFRSFIQPILIFLAIPFSWLGVAMGLYYTNNALSFFVMIGFFALIGIAVNNTILLTDYANQSLQEGLGKIDAIASALKARFRPLITTSITAVVALIPLALTDPFWESLAVTLIFGVLSSTFFVIITFPYFFLGGELFRSLFAKAKISALSKIRPSSKS